MYFALNVRTNYTCNVSENVPKTSINLEHVKHFKNITFWNPNFKEFVLRLNGINNILIWVWKKIPKKLKLSWSLNDLLSREKWTRQLKHFTFWWNRSKNFNFFTFWWNGYKNFYFFTFWWNWKLKTLINCLKLEMNKNGLVEMYGNLVLQNKKVILI